MPALINLRMETSTETLIFVNPDDVTAKAIKLAINDGEVIAEASMDVHEIDMLIAFLQAAKAQLRQSATDARGLACTS